MPSILPKNIRIDKLPLSKNMRSLPLDSLRTTTRRLFRKSPMNMNQGLKSWKQKCKKSTRPKISSRRKPAISREHSTNKYTKGNNKLQLSNIKSTTSMATSKTARNKSDWKESKYRCWSRSSRKISKVPISSFANKKNNSSQVSMWKYKNYWWINLKITINSNSPSKVPSSSFRHLSEKIERGQDLWALPQGSQGKSVRKTQQGGRCRTDQLLEKHAHRKGKIILKPHQCRKGIQVVAGLQRGNIQQNIPLQPEQYQSEPSQHREDAWLTKGKQVQQRRADPSSDHNQIQLNKEFGQPAGGEKIEGEEHI